MALVNLSIHYTWKNIKSEYNNNKFKISVATWNDKFSLPDRSYSVSDIQDDLAPRAILIFRLPLIAKRCAGVEVTYKIILNISSKNMKL